MKNPKLKKILVVLSCIPILFVGLSVPIGAVVNSTTGPAGNNELYSQSVFPFSVGFVYGDINDDGRYIMSTPVGNWGVEQNQTQNGVDEFDFANILTSNVGDNTDTGSISYEFGERTYPEVQHYVNDSNGYKYRGGYYDMSLTASVPEFVDNVTSIVFRGRDIYYNPVWNNKFFTSDAGFGPKNYLIPTFTLPELSDPTTQAFVGSYSVVAQIIDGYGKQHEVNYSISIDTRTDGLGPYMFISRDALAPYVSYSDTTNDIRSSANDTIIISEFTGYLDLQYYDYVVPVGNSTFSIYYDSTFKGTYEFEDGMTWSQFVNSSYNPDNIYVDGYKDFYLGGTVASAPVFYMTSGGSGFYVRTSVSGSIQHANDLIINGYSYNYFASGGGGSGNDPGIDGPSASDDFDWGAGLDEGPSASIYDVTPTAEEGTWEPATNTALASQINVSVPIYDSAASTSVVPGSSTWNLWSLPIASKYIKTTDLFQVINESISKDYTTWLAKATGGFLDAQIFPGFTFGGVMGTLIAFSVVMLFLKLFAGG